MGLMRRLAAAALAAVLVLSTALGERVTFRLSADIDPVQYPAQERKLAQGLKSLFRLLTVEGDVVASDGSFDARIDLSLTNAPEKTATRIRFFGLDSHWGIQATDLGGETLMFNQLAWLEFAIKAYNHLDLPLQRVFLWLSPYAHTSAWAGVRQSIADLAAQETSGRLENTALIACAEEIARLSEDDRALYYYIEAFGLESGTDADIFDALATLPEYVEANFPDGLSIEHTENGISWQNGEETVFSYADADGTQVVSLHLPDLVDFSATLRRDALLFTGALSLQSDVLNADVSFSLPASYPVTLPFYAQIDADGMMTGDDGIHLAFEGEAQGDTVIIRRIQPDHSATMMTLTVKVIQVAEGTVKYAPEDVQGTNVLSVDGPALAELMGRIGKPMVRKVTQWLAALPAELVQGAMDAMEDSGLLGTLTDAILNGEAGEY